MNAIVTDLDDTLIGSGDKPILPMLNLLLDAHENGIRIIVVSGRSLNRLDETKQWLDENGLEVEDSDIHLSDFPAGPNASEAFKVFKAKKLLDENIVIDEWYENDSSTRTKLSALGINVLDPANVRALSPSTPGAPDFGTGTDVNTQAPQDMRDNAHDGLKFYAEGRGGDGLTAQTIREARDMVKGIVSLDKWKRIAAWVARHRGDWENVAQNNDMKDPNWPGAGAVAAYLWGVDPTDPDSADKVIAYANNAVQDETSKDGSMNKRDVPMTDVMATGVNDVAADNAAQSDLETYSLPDCLQSLLADVFTMYTTAHGFHWNVTGPNFPQFHKLFGKIYQNVFESIDPIGENILKLGQFVKFRLPDLVATRMADDTEVQTGDGVFLASELLDINDDVLASLNRAFIEATNANEQGIMNFIAGRIDEHQTIAWQLRAVTGSIAVVPEADMSVESVPADILTNPTKITPALFSQFLELYKTMGGAQ